MKVSFIVVFATTEGSHLTIKDDSFPSNPEVDRLLIKDTKYLLQQIESIPIEKEILLMDNTGDFPSDFSLPSLKIIESVQALYLKDKDVYMTWFDKIPPLKKPGQLRHHCNHTAFCSLAFQHGVESATGDYVVMQHNDTEYMFNYYSKDNIINDAISYLEENNLSYLTIDKKPPKQSSTPGVEYFADCYWFLCRRDFYDVNNIYIDWQLGDTNYLATTTCIERGLKFEHLPGFYEGQVIKEANNTAEWKNNLHKKYPELLPLSVNIHTFKDIPFLLHVKGGTGLSGTLKKKYYYDSSYIRG